MTIEERVKLAEELHTVTSPIIINLREEESNIWEMGRKLETCL